MAHGQGASSAPGPTIAGCKTDTAQGVSAPQQGALWRPGRRPPPRLLTRGAIQSLSNHSTIVDTRVGDNFRGRGHGGPTCPSPSAPATLPPQTLANAPPRPPPHPHTHTHTPHTPPRPRPPPPISPHPPAAPPRPRPLPHFPSPSDQRGPHRPGGPRRRTAPEGAGRTAAGCGAPGRRRGARRAGRGSGARRATGAPAGLGRARGAGGGMAPRAGAAWLAIACGVGTGALSAGCARPSRAGVNGNSWPCGVELALCVGLRRPRRLSARRDQGGPGTDLGLRGRSQEPDRQLLRAQCWVRHSS